MVNAAAKKHALKRVVEETTPVKSSLEISQSDKLENLLIKGGKNLDQISP